MSNKIYGDIYINNDSKKEVEAYQYNENEGVRKLTNQLISHSGGLWKFEFMTHDSTVHIGIKYHMVIKKETSPSVATMNTGDWIIMNTQGIEILTDDKFKSMYKIKE